MAIVLMMALVTGLAVGGGARADQADAASDAAAVRVFELRIEGRKLPQADRVIRVTQGDRVRLHWTADEPLILHLHGYDIERRVASGAVAEMAFEAHATGRFSVHVHDESHTSAAGHSHEAPLAQLEVYPR
ncbi:MAG: hypothetical protein ACFCUQ_18245 [Kiloniellales bacterium]